MKIRNLIDLLEQYEHDSDEGMETDVAVTVHCLEWNTSGFNVAAKIENVAITFGNGDKDAVEIDIVLKSSDLDRLQELRTTLEENDY